MKQIFLAALPLLLLAGCATDKEEIYFASAVRPPAPPAAGAGAVKSLPKEDERQIQLLVYADLLIRRPWEGGNYSALFVQADDDVVDAIIKKYPGHVPPIKQSWHIDLRSKVSPRDKDTGEPVMILGADIGEPNADGSVDVVGRWYGGAANQGVRPYLMKKDGGVWTIAIAK